ncbi:MULTISPECIES: hypothetical protein [Bacillaceae]
MTNQNKNSKPQKNTIKQSQAEQTLKNQANIQDTDRAWEDDRL